MKLTSLVFYRYSLLLPYVILGLLYPFLQLGLKSDPFSIIGSVEDKRVLVQVASVISGFLLVTLTFVSMVYWFGLPYWALPYTILAVFLWIASLNKTKKQVVQMFIWSPVYLALSLTFFYIIVSSFNLFPDLFYLGNDVLMTSLVCMFPAPIAFGYVFISITAWVYYYLQRRGVIVEEII